MNYRCPACGVPLCMKTITIERVENGWIVRPFEPREAWANRAVPCWVYHSVAEIQAHLPTLLADEPCQREHGTCGEAP